MDNGQDCIKLLKLLLGSPKNGKVKQSHEGK